MQGRNRSTEIKFPGNFFTFYLKSKLGFPSSLFWSDPILKIGRINFGFVLCLFQFRLSTCISSFKQKIEFKVRNIRNTGIKSNVYSPHFFSTLACSDNQLLSGGWLSFTHDFGTLRRFGHLQIPVVSSNQLLGTMQQDFLPSFSKNSTT